MSSRRSSSAMRFTWLEGKVSEKPGTESAIEGRPCLRMKRRIAISISADRRPSSKNAESTSVPYWPCCSCRL